MSGSPHKLGYMREYYAKNRERILAVNREYRARDPERHAAAGRAYHHRNRDVILEKKRKRWDEAKDTYNSNRKLRKYGLTREQYDAMLLAQGHKCKICNQARSLVIYHNHRTGQVRGLLCDMCNRAIGLLHEDTERMKSAIDYLNQPQQQVAPQ